MTLSQARLILELLTNAGWMDDADEILGYILDDKEDGGFEVAETKANEIDELISSLNEVLPKEEQITPFANQTLNNILNYSS